MCALPSSTPRQRAGGRTDLSVAKRHTWTVDFLIGESKAILDAVALANEAGTSQASAVLITGETGTGKELFARGVHACSPGVHEPFVQIHCASLSGAPFERELFGCEPEAFADIAPKRGLLEVAANGTVLLDEIHELSPFLQAKVLAVLECGTFRRFGGEREIPLTTRIIATATAPLENAVNDGLFSPALYQRLSAMRLDVPPLRVRDGDVVLLARHFLDRIAVDSATTPLKLSTEAANALAGYPWAGNVRELKNVIERAVLVCTSDTIQRRQLLFQRRRVLPDAGEVASIIQIPADGKSLEAITRDAIHVTLILTQGNLSTTARILGISRPTLARKMRDAELMQQSALAVS